MKNFFLITSWIYMVLIIILSSCHKDSISDYRYKIIGKYYCKRIDNIIANEDSAFSSPTFIPRIVTKQYFDTILVELQNQDSFIYVDKVPFFLSSKYTFHSPDDVQMVNYNGFFRNDSIYYYYDCICGSNFKIIGKKI